MCLATHTEREMVRSASPLSTVRDTDRALPLEGLSNRKYSYTPRPTTSRKGTLSCRGTTVVDVVATMVYLAMKGKHVGHTHAHTPFHSRGPRRWW